MKQYEHLILEGGSFSGIAYCGVLYELDRLGILDPIKYFAGSSSGAVILMLYVMGFSPQELCDIFKNYNFNILNTCYPMMIWNFFHHNGLYSIKPVIRHLKSIVARKQDPNITFIELFNQTGKFLVVSVVPINSKRPIYVNPSSHPHERVIDAVQASITIPIIFTPTIHSFSEIKEPYIDGGILDNYPLWIFTQDHKVKTVRDTNVPPNTLGIKLVYPSETNNLNNPTTITQFILRLVLLYSTQLERVVINNEYTQQTIECIIPDEFGEIGFHNINPKNIQRLIQIGIDTIKTNAENKLLNTQ